MASLANQTISSTYDGLIKTSTDQPVGVSGVQLLEDGVGNTLALSVGRANQGVTVTGTLTATTLTGTVSATSVLADGVTATTQSAGDNSTKVATTAYVDAQVTASDLDFAGGTGTGAVDLDSQTFTIAGTANEIETSASGQTITIGLPSSVTVGTLTATTLAGTLSTAAQTNITSVGTLSSLTVSGDLTVDTNTLYVNSTNNRVGVGTVSPDYALDVNVSTDADWAARVKNTSSTGYGLYVEGSENNSQYILGLNNGLAYQMVVTGDGKVGIGTSSPSANLHIYKSDFPAIRLSNANGFSNIYQDTSGVISYSADDGATATNSGHIFYVDGSERLRIDSSGRVGIGTSSPEEKIHIKDGRLRFLETGQRQYDIGIVSGTDRFAITDVSGSSERMCVTYTGNVGIGTSSPTQLLHLYRSDTFSTMLLENGASNSYALYVAKTANSSTWQWGVWNDNSYRVGVSGVADYMTITSGGNVGIGTSSPNGKLTLSYSSSSIDGLTFINTASGGRQWRIGDGSGASAGYFGFYDATAATTRMVIDSSGNVGIGTGSPSYKLDVGGASNIDSTARFAKTSEGSLLLGGNRSTSNCPFIGSENNYAFAFITNNTERMRITSGGFLKVSNTGTYLDANATYHEILSSSGSVQTLNMRNYHGSQPYGMAISYPNADPNSGSSNYFFQAGSTGGDKAVIWSNGDVDNATGSYGTISSDIRLKENINPATSKLEDILSLNVVNYNYIGDDKKQLGFIAQEFEQVFPSLVKTRDTREYDEDGNLIKGLEDQKGLKVGMEFAILTKAIQEQQEIINDLKARIETLENN